MIRGPLVCSGLSRSASSRGATYWVGARIAEEKRSPDQWSISLLLNIHRKLFSSVFPEHAGKLRLKDVTFRSHIIPAPGQIQYRLTDIVLERWVRLEEDFSSGSY